MKKSNCFLQKNVCLVLLLLVSCSTFSQGYFKHHELTTPAPNTAELGKYGFSEISKYTGIPNISIPIYEMDFDGLKIPLALSYHAGGIRVSQESSWAGLGWSLTANAAITRSINQVSDIGSRKRVSANRLGDYGYCFEKEVPDIFDSPYQDYLQNYEGLLQADTQPDIFVANLFGKTVKFILTQKESDTSPIPSERRIKTKIIDGSNVKISYNDYYKNFTIVDENGFRYFFDKKEYSTNVYNYNTDRFFYDEYCDGCDDFSLARDMHIISGWYLRSVTSPHGKVLDFNYYLDGEEDKYFISISQPTHSQSRTDTVCAEGPLTVGTEKHEAVNVPSQTVQENAYLKDITNSSNGNRIVFKLGDREDLINSDTWNGSSSCRLPGYVYLCLNDGVKNPKKLDEIQVINSQGKIVKKIKLNHSYFNSDKILDERKEAYLRLKLDGIDIDNMSYSFNYNLPNQLPKKTSKDFDFFGFYNSAGNESIYPSVSVQDKCYNGAPSDFDYTNTDSKRGSNSAFGNIGLLNKVTYPTKGSSEYFYESNSVTMNPVEMPYTYSLLLDNNLESGYPKNANSSGTLKTFKIGGARIAKIINKDHNGQITKVRRYTYEDANNTNILKSHGLLMNRMIYYNVGDGTDTRGTKYTNIIINSRNALGTENSAQGNHVGYSKVEEIITNNTDDDNIGKIVTEFINKPNEASNSDGYLIINSPPYHYEAENGDIISEKIFDAANIIKSKTTYQYVYKRNNVTNAYKVFYINLRTTFGDCDLNQCQPVVYKQVLWYNPYNIYETINLNTSTKRETYENGKTITQNSFNTYNEKNLLASTEVSSSGSNIKHRTENYYPFDQEYDLNRLPYVSSLSYSNRITTPIYTREYRNNNLVKHTLFTYGNFDGLILPSAIKENKKDISFDQMDTRVNFVNYDDYGNLLEISRPGSSSTSYVWGYEKQYLVAKIQNVSYSDTDINALIENDIVSDSNTSDTILEAELNKLRQGIPNAMVSTYTYTPQVGVTKMTDPKGYTMSYKYDQDERLIASLDDQDYLINQNNYKYKGHEDFCLDCGPKSSLTTNNYSVEKENNTTFNISISGFTSTALKWELDFGDESSQTGIGNPPASYSHTYNSLGIKVAKLFIYLNENDFVTTNTNVLVVKPSDPIILPGGDIYFSNIISSGPSETTARLNGDPGATITYDVRCGGANSAQSGIAYVNGNGTSVSVGELSSERTVLIPPSGYVNCSVRHNSSDGTSQGSTVLRLVRTDRGQIISPSTVGDSFSHN